jgi:hypothetical protein
MLLTIQIGDLNGDGPPDIGVAFSDFSNAGRLAAFLNQGIGSGAGVPNALVAAGKRYARGPGGQPYKKVVSRPKYRSSLDE